MSVSAQQSSTEPKPESVSTDGKKRTVLILSTYALRLLGQGVSFFLFARALGAQNFGFVVATLAIFSPLSPLVDMGAYSLVSRDIALGRNPLQVIGENLTMMLFTLPLAMCGALLFAHLTNPSLNLSLLFMIGLAYLLISRTSLLLAAIQNTVNQRIPVIAVEAVSAFLLVGLGLFGLVYHYTLLQWSIVYMSIGLFILTISFILIRRSIGAFKLNHWPTLGRIGEGLSFSLGNTFQFIYTDIDKVILLKFATAQLTGVFGMTSRIGSLALIPIGAVYSMFYPRFMRSGHGIDIPISRLLMRVLTLALVYSALVILGIFLLSPIIPRFLGHEYAQVPSLLKVLTISIIFQIFQTPFADAITGMGFQIYRTVIQGIMCIFAVVGGILVIPANPLYGVLKLNVVVHGTLLALYVITYFILFLEMRRKSNAD
ncbi:hypothetical protein Dxin01_03156 [Deinococcus xinjiangensis]|uniref:Polysaccharide biosynthesis protein n=1 Tax=Deinococcus xinjiangensis TaxID=457454 RepID=A0ABP9VDT8_9DEIO